MWNVGISMGRRASMENVEHVGKTKSCGNFGEKKNLIGFFYFLSPKKYSFFGPSPAGGSVVARYIIFGMAHSVHKSGYPAV